ncbi:cell division protein FtsB [Pseudothauera nasutitermitis]|uniref:Cell division protein FtsB n=1 Tax=Pseudothauera nasutitermitis TaxID=2565930 RepID=A0A4S4B3D2_9RHOO|nr:cell division protein FtsB [Pseudothauera nasutitermitis]THF66250.1 cell division protein FtsB [Pseudothauera nasutitermitis]
MRWPVIILALLAVVLQYPLWLGKGGWLRVWEVDGQLNAQREVTHRLEQRNAALAAEVQDLKSGNEAVEERARFELGLTRPGEIYVHVPTPPRKPGEGQASAGAAASPQAGATATR